VERRKHKLDLWLAIQNGHARKSLTVPHKADRRQLLMAVKQAFRLENHPGDMFWGDETLTTGTWRSKNRRHVVFIQLTATITKEYG
jgi:predicted NAD-dependent protein-ADP-ribosyltransferase YbiA (DUF1768 family)